MKTNPTNKQTRQVGKPSNLTFKKIAGAVAYACALDGLEGNTTHLFAYSVRTRLQRLGLPLSAKRVRRALHELEKHRFVEAAIRRSAKGWGHPRYRATPKLMKLVRAVLPRLANAT